MILFILYYNPGKYYLCTSKTLTVLYFTVNYLYTRL